MKMSSATSFFAVYHFVYSFAATVITVGTRMIHMPIFTYGPRLFAKDIAIANRIDLEI